MQPPRVCTECGNGVLEYREYSDTFSVRVAMGVEVDFTVDGLKGYTCDTCGATDTYASQIRDNQSKIIQAQGKALLAYESAQ